MKLFNSSTPEMLREILDGHIDFAVLVMDSNYRHENLSITHLTDFEDIMIGGQAFSELNGRSISLKEFIDYPLVSMEKGTMTRQFFDQFFMSTIFSLNRILNWRRRT